MWCGSVKVCCSALQCVTVCRRVTRTTSQVLLVGVLCVVVCCSVLQCVAVRCSVLQCVAVCCSVLQSDSHSEFSDSVYCVVQCVQCVAACESTWCRHPLQVQAALVVEVVVNSPWHMCGPRGWRPRESRAVAATLCV